MPTKPFTKTAKQHEAIKLLTGDALKEWGDAFSIWMMAG